MLNYNANPPNHVNMFIDLNNYILIQIHTFLSVGIIIY